MISRPTIVKIKFSLHILQVFLCSQVVRQIVTEALEKFSADKIAMPDFALESAGMYYIKSTVVWGIWRRIFLLILKYTSTINDQSNIHITFQEEVLSVQSVPKPSTKTRPA